MPLDEFQDLAPDISIHALLAESDPDEQATTFVINEFLSTLSLRRATWPGLLARPFFLISIHALLAESDYDTSSLMQCQVKFLSTLSLRRATLRALDGSKSSIISIHALLAESD